MKKFVSFSAALFLVTGLTSPSIASTEYSVAQKTLSAYSGSTTTLNAQQRAQVKAALDANPTAEKFICTGIRLESAPMSENIVVRQRAKAACDYAKTLNPALSTFFQNRPTKARSYAGKVLLTLKMPLSASSPAPTPTPANLSSHPSITGIEQLTPIEVCKTSDVSFRSDTSNGFPRPSTAMTGTVSARILLLPIVFSDLPYTEEDDQRMRTATDRVTGFYEKTSYGKVSLTYEYLPKQFWVKMTKSAADYRLPENIPQYNKTFLVEDVFALADPSINFSLYDGVALTTGYSERISGGQGFPGVVFPTKNGVAKGVSLEIGRAAGNYVVMAHELGHSLFGLEDLYVFLNPNRPSVPDPLPAGPWDMMSSSASEFFGWNKLLMGWIESDQVRCLSNQSTTSHFIESIDQASNKPKLVLVNLSAGVTLAIEGRSSPSKGVLIYKIDTRINHGDGPITAQKSLLASGQQLTLDGWTIKVNASDASGFLVDLIRG